MERNEFNIIEELKNYLKNTPKEQQQKDWEDIKAYGEFGSTVDEFLYKNPIAPPYNSTVDEFEEFANAMDREEEIHNKANAVFNNALSSLNESTWGVRGFIEGAEWADSHPNGFINEEKYVNRLFERKDITNKEFIEMLQQFPDDALISVECCNPRAMIYDEKHNLIRID